MSKKSFSQLLAKSATPVLVDFHATWCGPCKSMAPALEAFAKEMSGKLKVVKVDIDKNQQAATQYGVRSVPTLLLFKRGQMAWRQSGALGLGQLRSALAPHLT